MTDLTRSRPRNLRQLGPELKKRDLAVHRIDVIGPYLTGSRDLAYRIRQVKALAARILLR